jgi:predicted PurR-regulated permease PerM
MNPVNTETEIAIEQTSVDGVTHEEVSVQVVEASVPPLSPPRTPPVHVRGMALSIIATVIFVFALQWAQKFLIPVMFGVFIAYTLNPVVVWLQHFKIPRVFGTTLVMAVILLGIGATANNLADEFNSILDGLPATAHKVSRALGKMNDGQPSAIQQMQAAATEIEKATNQAAGVRPSRKIAMLDQPSFKVNEWLWVGSVGAAAFIGQVTMVVFLVFFLLLSGDTFKRKLVRLTGPTLSHKKITVQILDEINTSVQNYMFMLLVTNTLLALLMWIALRWIGLENAGAWAVAAGLLHIIPYFGPLLITAATGLTAFVQFESVSMVLLVASSSLIIATLVGTLVTTWMTGKIAKMNPAAVFVSLLFWGWLWGICGMLLGIPIIFIIKVVSERIEGMQLLSELLGD